MVRLACLVLIAVSVALPQSPVQYDIYRASSKIVIDGKLDEAAWQLAPSAGDFVFHWFEGGDKEQTVAKMLWDDENLYVSWQCKDRHISAYEKQRHGPVSRDDCVEIFVSPNPNKVRNYYTWEINAIGTVLNRCRTDWWTGPPTWEPEGVEHRTTFHGWETKDEAPDDQEWIVELKIPFRNFARDAANIPPKDGDQWRLNLNRIGGKTNNQKSSWAPIAPPSKTFHTPESFGPVRFVAAQARGAGRRGQRFNPADAMAGREIYNRSCTMCHGLDGAAGDRAPALGAQRRYLRSTNDDLFDAIKNGIKGTLMPASPAPDAEVWKMVAFIRSLRASAIDMPVAGDAAKGESLFHGKAGCAGCHMIRGRGGILGPDLTDLGAQRSLELIRAALTEPKPAPPRGFVPVTVVTAAGRTIKGIVKNENNFSMQVLGEDQKLHLLLRREVREVQYGARSIMPADVNKGLNTAEFTDLMAFLTRLARHPQ